MGISDTNLHSARSKVASAAAPSAAGKNPTLVLLARDGATGTLDPAFEAHIGPVKHWALATWDRWQPARQMAVAFEAAKIKLGPTTTPDWNLATGPTTALIATLARISWRMPSPTQFVTDLGLELDCTLDPPIVIASECRESVRRWRLRLASQELPGLIPPAPDVGHCAPSPHDRLVTALSGIGSLLKGKPCKRIAGAICELWQARSKGDLASAIAGGQWSQARKAQVQDWGITDSRCQLCLKETGTIEHRFSCIELMPSGGWPKPPPAATPTILVLGDRRRRILRTRALAVLRLPPTEQHQTGEFRWLKQPDGNDPELDGAVWYCDGSLLHGRWKELRATGFGVAVATPGGRLLGYGLGRPPTWCGTAAAAEAWALQTVIQLCPFPPAMRTDCLSLLKTAQAGTQSATKASRPLARVWNLIAEAIGLDLSTLTSSGLLVWVPAHHSHNAVGEAKLSNGLRLSNVDWRANRLVDKLAKMAAGAHCEPEHLVELAAGLDAATLHAAALLGTVTHCANNHRITEMGDGGALTTRVVRDSVDKPRFKRVAATQAQPATPAPSLAATAPTCRAPARTVMEPAPWREPRATSAATWAQRQQVGLLARRVQDIGDSLRPSEDSGRLSRVRDRILSRVSRNPPQSAERGPL